MLVLCLVFALICAWQNNNVSWGAWSRAVFLSRLDGSARRGARWVENRYGVLLAEHAAAMDRVGGNWALLHMLDDMAAQEGVGAHFQGVIRNIVETFVARSSSHSDYPLQRLVNEAARVRMVSRAELIWLQPYQRWILFALAPSKVDMAEEDRNALFNAEKHDGRDLTHQLFALVHFRRQVGPSTELGELIDRVCERIASENTTDCAVTDMYLQRVAFLLAAGRPDLVKPRWVERVIANQAGDGGWTQAWFGVHPDHWTKCFAVAESDSHATVQALWLLHMVRHRHAQWVARHYQ